MSRCISEIKQDVEKKLLEFRSKRKGIIRNFRKKLEEVKIEKIKSSILNK